MSVSTSSPEMTQILNWWWGSLLPSEGMYSGVQWLYSGVQPTTVQYSATMLDGQYLADYPV